MSTPVRSLIKAVLRQPEDKLEILSFINYPYYDNLFAPLDTDWHLYTGNLLKNVTWDDNQVDLPKNFKLDVNPDIPLNIDIDLLVFHNRLEQYDITKMLSSFWHMPTCLIHGTTPRDMKFNPKWSTIQSRDGHSNIFLSQRIQEEWNKAGYIIPVGIEPKEVNTDKQKKISHIWCGAEQQKVLYNIVGPTHLVRKGDFSETLILINTTSSWYPIHVLEAMAAGCCVISADMPELNGVIEHGVSGLLFKDLEELQRLLTEYRAKPTTCVEMGQNGREKIVELFPMNKYIKSMNLALRESAEVLYVR